MKTELASQSGFSLPEKYFQVRREEGADNKHYSKIGTFLMLKQVQ
jgi:DNA repair protein RAD50